MCFSSLLISEILSSDPCLHVFVMLSCKILLYVSSEVSYMFLVLSAKTKISSDEVDTHFPAGHKLHKIFNRNTVKVSCSCMNNVGSIITNHNTRIIRKNQTQVISTDNCNCRNKEACPLQNKCMNKDIVYKATISTSNTNDTNKHYIGMTSNTFKERYRNHIKSFTHKKYSNETELSKQIWHLKQNKTDFTIKWSIIKKIYFLHGKI